MGNKVVVKAPPYPLLLQVLYPAIAILLWLLAYALFRALFFAIAVFISFGALYLFLSWISIHISRRKALVIQNSRFTSKWSFRSEIIEFDDIHRVDLVYQMAYQTPPFLDPLFLLFMRVRTLISRAIPSSGDFHYRIETEFHIYEDTIRFVTNDSMEETISAVTKNSGLQALMTVNHDVFTHTTTWYFDFREYAPFGNELK